MDMLGEERFVSPRTGKVVVVVAVHDPGGPLFTMVATCENCLAEISRRTFDSSKPDTYERAGNNGLFDALIAVTHECKQVASC